MTEAKFETQVYGYREEELHPESLHRMVDQVRFYWAFDRRDAGHRVWFLFYRLPHMSLDEVRVISTTGNSDMISMMFLKGFLCCLKQQVSQTWFYARMTHEEAMRGVIARPGDYLKHIQRAVVEVDVLVPLEDKPPGTLPE
jgi:hypothetical protein